MNILAPYLAALVSSLVIDGVWLTTMGSRFYRPQIGHLMASSPSLLAGALFYLTYPIAIAILVVSPALKSHQSLGQVFLMGALLGFAAYGAYDFTNQATLKDWPVIVTVVDLVWGTVLTGTVSVIAVSVVKALA